MMFKDVKKGDTLYVLDKQNLELTKQQVTDVSMPRMSMKNPLQLVMDITMDGKQYEVRADNNVAYAPQAITPDLDIVLAEIKQIKSCNESLLADVDKYRQTIAKADELLKANDPAYKQKEITEERFSKIEDQLEKILKKLDGKIS